MLIANHPKTCYCVKFSHSTTEEERKEYISDEYRFSEIVIRSNPKSYWSWNNRKLLVLRCRDLGLRENVWSNELNLCNAFLDLDSRNCKSVEYLGLCLK